MHTFNYYFLFSQFNNPPHFTVMSHKQDERVAQLQFCTLVIIIICIFYISIRVKSLKAGILSHSLTHCVPLINIRKIILTN